MNLDLITASTGLLPKGIEHMTFPERFALIRQAFNTQGFSPERVALEMGPIFSNLSRHEVEQLSSYIIDQDPWLVSGMCHWACSYVEDISMRRRFGTLEGTACAWRKYPAHFPSVELGTSRAYSLSPAFPDDVLMGGFTECSVHDICTTAVGTSNHSTDMDRWEEHQSLNWEWRISDTGQLWPILQPFSRVASRFAYERILNGEHRVRRGLFDPRSYDHQSTLVVGSRSCHIERRHSMCLSVRHLNSSDESMITHEFKRVRHFIADLGDDLGIHRMIDLMYIESEEEVKDSICINRSSQHDIPVSRDGNSQDLWMRRYYMAYSEIHLLQA